jgi:signal peptidase I
MIDDNAKLRNIYLKIKSGILDFSGESMEPVFKNGDKVKVESVEAKNIKTGNIIVFNRNILVCHRVWGRFKKDDKFYFWEKGDNSDCIGYISEDEIIRKAVYLVEKGKIKNLFFILTRKLFY